MKKTVLFACALVAVITAQGAAASTAAFETEAQKEAQIYFFKEALDQFGATDPDQAVRLWVKADETRNGVYKYAVGTDRIKQWLTDKWGKPEKNFWIIGGSSPWLSGYDIVSKTAVSPSEIKYVVQYNWTSSTPPEPSTVEHLTVTRINANWCVSRVNPVTGPSNY